METGIVINIHKKGTKSKYKNYRGITLLPKVYKLFTNIIKYRVNERGRRKRKKHQIYSN
jgi:hypothetical protein